MKLELWLQPCEGAMVFKARLNCPGAAPVLCGQLRVNHFVHCVPSPLLQPTLSILGLMLSQMRLLCLAILMPFGALLLTLRRLLLKLGWVSVIEGSVWATGTERTN